jgi:hypothetical protein
VQRDRGDPGPSLRFRLSTNALAHLLRPGCGAASVDRLDIGKHTNADFSPVTIGFSCYRNATRLCSSYGRKCGWQRAECSGRLFCCPRRLSFLRPLGSPLAGEPAAGDRAPRQRQQERHSRSARAMSVGSETIRSLPNLWRRRKSAPFRRVHQQKQRVPCQARPWRHRRHLTPCVSA